MTKTLFRRHASKLRQDMLTAREVHHLATESLRHAKRELASFLCPYSVGDVIEFDWSEYGKPRWRGRIDSIDIDHTGKIWIVRGKMITAKGKPGTRPFVCSNDPKQINRNIKLIK